jgi:hypothetical protein
MPRGNTGCTSNSACWWTYSTARISYGTHWRPARRSNNRPLHLCRPAGYYLDGIAYRTDRKPNGGPDGRSHRAWRRHCNGLPDCRDRRWLAFDKFCHEIVVRLPTAKANPTNGKVGDTDYLKQVKQRPNSQNLSQTLFTANEGTNQLTLTTHYLFMKTKYQPKGQRNNA